MGQDGVANRPVGDLPDRRQEFPGDGRGDAGVDDQGRRVADEEDAVGGPVGAGHIGPGMRGNLDQSTRTFADEGPRW